MFFYLRKLFYWVFKCQHQTTIILFTSAIKSEYYSNHMILCQVKYKIFKNSMLLKLAWNPKSTKMILVRSHKSNNGKVATIYLETYL